MKGKKVVTGTIQGDAGGKQVQEEDLGWGTGDIGLDATGHDCAELLPSLIQNRHDDAQPPAGE